MLTRPTSLVETTARRDSSAAAAATRAAPPEVVLPPHPDRRRSPARSCRSDAQQARSCDRPAAPGRSGRSERVSAGVGTGVAPFVTTCFGPRTARRGVHREDLADDEPVTEHADSGQVLL